MKPPVTRRKLPLSVVKARRSYTCKPEVVEAPVETARIEQPEGTVQAFVPFDQQLIDARNIAANEERQAVIAMLEQTAASLLGPLGGALQDGRFMGQLTPEHIMEHIKALIQSAERIRRGDHRRTAP